MKPYLKRFGLIASILVLLLNTSCQTSTQTSQHVFALQTSSDKNDSGFGGTGLINDSGFGGTGVMGVVTGFGSIWVNGLHIKLDQQTQVQSQAEAFDLNQLEIGHQVSVKLRKNTDLAERVEVFWPIQGPVSHVDSDNQTIQVLGQTIQYDQHTQGLDQFKVGEFVRINSFGSANHQAWYATRIESQPGQQAYVEATLNQTPDQSWTAAGTKLESNQLPQNPQQGQLVRLEFKTENKVPRLTSVEPVMRTQRLESQRLLIQGQPQRVGDSWWLEGVKVEGLQQTSPTGLQLFALQQDQQGWQILNRIEMRSWLKDWPQIMRQSIKPNQGLRMNELFKTRQLNHSAPRGMKPIPDPRPARPPVPPSPRH
ncbi:MAG: hypothetical protein IBX48_08855 [Thiomicrospira sp.]|uniref:DUF5666 domain-containing protein n=1 Tax=Thiomicrospira sp. TaxID=935 RepID=UPI0019FA4A6F|nr:DUF5666 domain-containing protein [Thiomicrospira sp.]MBE0494437.1 hypothetical protein [Thiomicrospira sp.]